MPKLTKQAFFPCNPHGAVRSATVYAAAATPGAAQSGSGSSRLLGGMRDTSASLTKKSVSLQCQALPERDTPLQNATTAWGWACAPPATGHHRGAKHCPALPLSRAQGRYHRSPPGTCWAVGWEGGQLPLPSLQKSILMKEITAGSAGWPGLPEGTARCQGLAVLRVR